MRRYRRCTGFEACAGKREGGAVMAGRRLVAVSGGTVRVVGPMAMGRIVALPQGGVIVIA